MKRLVTGAGGMLAQAVLRHAAARGEEVVAKTRADLDVTDADAVLRCLEAERPEIVIQGAAYTAVDRAEAEPELAYRVNVEGTRNVARACQKIGCVFVYLSTDYVFDGEADRPYVPSHPPNPLSVYGRTKWEGEVAAAEAGRALIVRTSWLFGEGGTHFVDTIVRLASDRKVIDIVGDQIGRPTWTDALADTIDKLLKAGSLGTFHASGAGDAVSWATFAEEIVRRFRLDVEVRRITTAELKRAATRPRYSVLDLSETEAVVGPLGDWRDSFVHYLEGRDRR